MSSITQMLVVMLVVLDCHPRVTCRLVPKRSLKLLRVGTTVLSPNRLLRLRRSSSRSSQQSGKHCATSDPTYESQIQATMEDSFFAPLGCPRIRSAPAQ